MVFKNECTKFLDSITALRSTAINNAVNDAIQAEHLPYERDMIATRDALIIEERNKTTEQIRVLQAELERKVKVYNEETNNAIVSHKNRIVADATAKAAVHYDNFILGVGKLVDETKL